MRINLLKISVIFGLCGFFSGVLGAAAAEPLPLEFPLGLDEEEVLIPSDNPITKEKVALGRSLYFDPRLSKDNTVSCATCHSPAFGFTDGQPVSTGIGGQKGGRSAPTVINRIFSKAQFWDGRAASLEEQAKGPITNPIEMGMPDHATLVRKLNNIPGYRRWFQEVFGTDVTIDGIAKAIATFERTVLSGNSALDKHNDAIEGALSESAQRGLKLFKGDANCGKCHAGFNFTDEKFHNLGVSIDKPNPDLGLQQISKKAEDRGKFKTPTLRDIAATAPYMHDGSLATLEEVVDFYDKGGVANPQLDKEMKKLNLTDQQKRDLVALMKAMSGEGWQNITPPATFPQ